MAPGVNVLSSVPHTFCDDRHHRMLGLHAEHVDGRAAPGRDCGRSPATHPDWEAWQVNSVTLELGDVAHAVLYAFGK